MLREIIEKSHQRSKNYGISVNQKKSNRVLSAEELTQKLKDSSDLILASETIINKLYNQLKNADFISVLTDSEGCILSIIGNEKIGEFIFDLDIRPGVYMDEKNIGTNAIGLALFENTPVQLYDIEHYLKSFYGITCSCVPIHDEKNTLIGTLDLSGYNYSIHTHILGTLIAAGYAIEKNYALSKILNKVQNNSNCNLLFYTLPIPAIIIDKEGFVLCCNDKIDTIFGYLPANINIYELITNWHHIQNLLDSNKTVIDIEVNINSKLNRIKTFISVHKLNNKLNILNYICYFRDIHLTRKSKENVNNLRAKYTFDKLIGQNIHFLRTIEFAKKISNSKSTVLLIGESGTGKEIFAQSIQNYSNRKNKPFIAISCGAIPENLIESELFGYVDGAFTGASKGGKMGKFELADGGTIFLDEIGELPYELQNRLLRVIEEETISRIGGTEKTIDVRIIAASNKDLKKEVEEKHFRKDLYYRLNVLPIYLSPLRERKEDIPLLIDFYQDKISNHLNKRKIPIPKDYNDKLLNYSWPGNIRELQNFVELIINTEKLPTFDHNKILHEALKINLFDEENLTLLEIEKHHISKILKKYDYNISISADALGIARNTLYRKIKKLDIDCSKM